MSMFDEFKKFALKGNVVDMAVGVIIGGAFGKIVSSFVSDIVMPPLGLMTGGVDFSNQKIILKAAEVGTDGKEIAATTLNYGLFLNAVVSFVIVAFALFMVIKAMNAAKAKEEAAAAAAATPPAPPEPPAQERLLAEIRDLLKSQR